MPAMKSNAVIFVIDLMSPSLGGLYEYASDGRITTKFGDTAYSPDSAPRTWNIVSAPSTWVPFGVNGPSMTLSMPLNTSTPRPTSARAANLGANVYVAAPLAITAESRP